MRLTGNMMVKNLMRNLNSNYKKMDRLSNELSTGRKIMQPSDDPVASLRSMQLQTVVHQNNQYIKNIDQAVDWIDTSESALDEVNSVLLRTRELAIYGASDTLGQDDRDSILQEVEQLSEHLVQIANTSIGGRFVFSGQKTTTKPYVDYNSAYQGDNKYLGVEISKSVSIDFSIPGNSVFDQAFQAMRDLSNDLSTGNTTNLSTVTLDKIDDASDLSLALRSHLGSKMKRLELAKNRFEDANVKHTQLLTELENVDIAETIMNLKNEENVYRASLAVGARVIQPSLVDFIK